MSSKRKILVVDDSAGNLLLMQYTLDGFFDVEVVSSGASAINKCKENEYDVILMDINMPEMDGIETTLNIRNLLPTTNSPLIFALTSNILPEAKQKCLKAGMDGYIMKPVHVKTLVQKINQTINTKEI